MNWRKLKANPNSWQILKLRAEILERIRQFFKKEGFLEVQTPILAPALIPESYLEFFETKLKDKMGNQRQAFLTTSPEMWHKRLLVAKSCNIFEITKSFRNTDIGSHFHNPEFTLLEWYRVGTDYQQTMVDCENLIRFLNKKSSLYYQGKNLLLDQPFERISVATAFEKYAKISPSVLFNKGQLTAVAKKRGYKVTKDESFEVIYHLLFLQEVEPNLGWPRPTIIYDFPAQLAPLAKTSKKDPRLKERFEVYLFGIELADGYNELTNPYKQKAQFKKEVKLRQKMGKTNHLVDWEFIEALKAGLPDSSGVALGVDRLLMIFSNKTDINEVILFSGKEIFNL